MHDGGVQADEWEYEFKVTINEFAMLLKELYHIGSFTRGKEVVVKLAGH